MLLFNIFSTGGKIVPQETLPGLRCPACGQKSSLRLFRSEHTLRLLGMPILHRRVRCFAVCPSCGHVFDPIANVPAYLP